MTSQLTQEDNQTNEKKNQPRNGKLEDHRQDRLSNITWALILIWAGVAFLAVSQGWLENLNLPLPLYYRYRLMPRRWILFNPLAWNLAFLGAGVILLLEVLIRLFVPAFHQRIGGSLVLAAMFIGMGLGNWLGWEIVWPLILIAIGAIVLINGLTHKN